MVQHERAVMAVFPVKGTGMYETVKYTYYLTLVKIVNLFMVKEVPSSATIVRYPILLVKVRKLVSNL